jgi:hypothetical protein
MLRRTPILPNNVDKIKWIKNNLNPRFRTAVNLSAKALLQGDQGLVNVQILQRLRG